MIGFTKGVEAGVLKMIGFTAGDETGVLETIDLTTGDEAGVLKMIDFTAEDDFSRQRVTLQMRHGLLDEEKTKKEIKMVSIAPFVSFFWCSTRGRLDKNFTCCFTLFREFGIGILFLLEMVWCVKSEVKCSVCSRKVLRREIGSEVFCLFSRCFDL